MGFAPTFEFNLTDIMLFTMPLVNKFQTVIISLSSLVALFLFGAMQEEGEVSQVVFWLGSMLWVGWFVVGVTEFLRIFLRAGRRRAKGRAMKRGSGAVGEILEMHLRKLKSTESTEELTEEIEGIGIEILSGDAGMFSPGLA